MTTVSKYSTIKDTAHMRAARYSVIPGTKLLYFSLPLFESYSTTCFHILWLMFNALLYNFHRSKIQKGGHLQWPRTVQNPTMTNPYVQSNSKRYGQTNSIWLLCTAGFITSFFKLQGRIKNREPNSFTYSQIAFIREKKKTKHKNIGKKHFGAFKRTGWDNFNHIRRRV